MSLLASIGLALRKGVGPQNVSGGQHSIGMSIHFYQFYTFQYIFSNALDVCASLSVLFVVSHWIPQSEEGFICQAFWVFMDLFFFYTSI